MGHEPVTVRFLPMQETVKATVGDTLLDVALDNGIALAHECGGNCACTTCHVLIIEGMGLLSLAEEVEADRLTSAEDRTISSRLGCQAILTCSGYVELMVPASEQAS